MKDKNRYILYIEVQDDIGVYKVYYRNGDTFTNDIFLASKIGRTTAFDIQSKIFMNYNIIIHVKEIENA